MLCFSHIQIETMKKERLWVMLSGVYLTKKWAPSYTSFNFAFSVPYAEVPH